MTIYCKVLKALIDYNQYMKNNQPLLKEVSEKEKASSLKHEKRKIRGS
jgi:hypothetical protein